MRPTKSHQRVLNAGVRRKMPQAAVEWPNGGGSRGKSQIRDCNSLRRDLRVRMVASPLGRKDDELERQWNVLTLAIL